MQTSLGLDGDLDDVDLVEDIETAFAVRFADEDISKCRTVGDVFALVAATLPKNKVGGSCATAMCFYRLRRALQPRHDIELRPDTPIDQLRVDSVRELYRLIEHDCDLRAPPKIISVWGCIALVLIGALPLASVMFGASWWMAAASAFPAVAFYAAAPIRLPADVANFGDLVRRVADRSIGSLQAKGARVSSPEAWSAFKGIVADHTVLPRDEISPDTLLLTPAKAART
jgi:hypothetical protein